MNDLRGFLEEVAADPPPPSAVDVDRAVHEGRRGIRRRRFTAVGAGALTVVALAGVTVAVSQGYEPTVSNVGGSPSAGTTASVQPPPMPAVAPKTFDPKVRYAGFGWLPDGLTDSSVQTERTRLIMDVSAPRVDVAKDPGRIVLTVVAAGVEIPMGGDELATDPINGRPAHWRVPGPIDADAVLGWEYAPGAWAALVVSHLGADVDAKEVARRVAADIRFGANTPITLPLRAGTLPQGFSLGAVQVTHQQIDGRDNWSARAVYGPTGGPAVGYDGPLTITAVPRDSKTGDDSVIGDPNTTVDGHPARVTRNALQLFNVDGLYLELQAEDGVVDGIPDGLKGIFRGLELFPDPADWR